MDLKCNRTEMQVESFWVSSRYSLFMVVLTRNVCRLGVVTSTAAVLFQRTTDPILCEMIQLDFQFFKNHYGRKDGHWYCILSLRPLKGASDSEDYINSTPYPILWLYYDLVALFILPCEVIYI
jgi:hypothetical protein